MRKATLDLNSRGSFVDDLNSKPGIVMCRDALLHRSHEIQPAFFDSEIKRTFLVLFVFFFFLVWGKYVAPARGSTWPRYGLVGVLPVSDPAPDRKQIADASVG